MNYKQEYIYSPKCYESCGGYCCAGFTNQHFKLIRSNFIALPLFDIEYQEYLKAGAIDGMEMAKKSEKFKLKGSQTFTIHWLHCDKKGLCNPHQNRPLICKLYPILPKVNAKGEIIGFFNGTIFDIFFTDFSHPCTLIKEQRKNIEDMLKANLKELLKNPNYIFIFKVAQIVVEHLQNYIKAKFGTYIIDEIPSNKVAEFWSQIEMAMVLRRAWNSDKFISDINRAYEEIAKIWGEFLQVEV
ncbi:hypothetical protein V2I29_07480 [Campylobacter sp. CX2-8023-23]|uniref:hypothetical protein n=1 Tax=Campylobacter porcelli TaxID=1660073 RepID=UPI002EA76DA8|nr:hypothetical protein [Campylobacter sp. CX2-8023-23]